MTDRFTRGVHHEVSNRHLTIGNERRETCQETNRDHKAADEFNDSAEEHQTLRATMPAGKAKDFLTAVTCEHKAHY